VAVFVSHDACGLDNRVSNPAQITISLFCSNVSCPETFSATIITVHYFGLLKDAVSRSKKAIVTLFEAQPLQLSGGTEEKMKHPDGWMVLTMFQTRDLPDIK
jgi:hypothetical protein